MSATPRFQDLDLDFIRHPMSGDVALKQNAEAVKRSLRNLILYKRYEKPFHPEIVSGVTDMLFEQVSFVTTLELQKRIDEIIKNYEPRVANVNVTVGYNVDKGQFDINIKFSVKNSLSRVETLNLSVERLR